MARARLTGHPTERQGPGSTSGVIPMGLGLRLRFVSTVTIMLSSYSTIR